MQVDLYIRRKMVVVVVVVDTNLMKLFTYLD